ncbi:tyrosine-type recombinase/integrase [Nonomuraea rosea]|uniref:Tyrosine-type recombinase/integrase n=1 Tax=Nonomuraea rosea TaxID=638574 RepID=A0ABP6ZQM1_9ACTN
MTDVQPEPRKAGQPGLLAKLMAVVQPEFRPDVLIPDLRDPIFGGPPCMVVDCDYPVLTMGLCRPHYNRWHHDRPDLREYAAAAGPPFTRHTALACTVAGCRYGRRAQGLCSQHLYLWNQAGRPQLVDWIAAQPPVAPNPFPRICLVAECEIWVHQQTPLCPSHAQAWRKAGRPELEDFVARYTDPFPDEICIDLRALGPQLRLEVQYALQCRRNEHQGKLRPFEAMRTIRFLVTSQVTSLLDHDEHGWRQRMRVRGMRDSKASTFLIFARWKVQDLTEAGGWDAEYPRDVWRLRRLGIEDNERVLRFDGIPQPWLRDLAKRWARWRLSTGLNRESAARPTRAIARFATFLASDKVGVTRLADVDRAVLERYLADLHAEMGGSQHQGNHIGLLNAFFTAIRQHRWDDDLPTTAVFFTEDYPKRAERLPRALAEQIMTQLEDPANLARWDDPAKSLITLVLMRCGLRLADALALPCDCIVRDADGAPYLRYFNHKMKREALVPIDDELCDLIGRQRAEVCARFPDTTPVLFPRHAKNPDGTKTMAWTTYRRALNRWLNTCDFRDEYGQPVHLTPHQWRHTLGTRLINRDVPQEVVRRILDHDSHAMTAHYARLSDTTIRRHWEKARKVNANGETVTLDPDGPVAEAAWAKQRISRATQALPNGYCSLPLIKTRPHANACLTCPMFVTTAEFLPQHREQHRQTLQIISVAEAAGRSRQVEMNRQVADNLEKIITSLETDQQHPEATPDAS